MPLSLVVALLVAGAVWLWRVQDRPRREGLGSLQHLQATMMTGSVLQLPALVALPAAIRGRTPAEQGEFLVKALRDEITAEGLTALSRKGRFGPLTNVFPAEAAAWASNAAVPAAECVAFRFDGNDFRTEVVLWAPSNSPPQTMPRFRIVRCNDVHRLASPGS